MNEENQENTSGPIRRWSARRKQEVVLRLLAGEAIDGVTLGTVAVGVVGWVVGFGIAALGSGTMHVEPVRTHFSHGTTEGKVSCALLPFGLP